MLERSFASTQTLQLAELHTFDVFYTPLEARFDRITRLARRALQVPVAAIGLLHAGRVWYKSVDGWNVVELPADKTFCGHAIASNGGLIVEDTRTDSRFAKHPLTVAHPRFRFYAGVPLRGRGDFPLGTLSVYDTKPRVMSAGQIQALRDLGDIAQKELLTTELLAAQAEFLSKLGVARRQASLDELTRVWNRRAGLEMLRTMLEQARVNRGTIAVCMVDVDRFKAINDEYGHQCGDQVLRKLTSIIVGSLRGEEIVCRYGGDEFLLVFDNIDRQRLTDLTTRVCQRIGEKPIGTHRGQIPVTISIGATLSAGGAHETVETLVERADRALYRCKASGRNSIEIASWREGSDDETNTRSRLFGLER
jgi:diguanylate cyclase (GGDEF)-like protein